MDYQKQIEEILKSSENKNLSESFASVADGLAVFFFTLLDRGFKRDEAFDLTTEYLVQLMASNRPNV